MKWEATLLPGEQNPIWLLWRPGRVKVTAMAPSVSHGHQSEATFEIMKCQSSLCSNTNSQDKSEWFIRVSMYRRWGKPQECHNFPSSLALWKVHSTKGGPKQYRFPLPSSRGAAHGNNKCPFPWNEKRKGRAERNGGGGNLCSFYLIPTGGDLARSAFSLSLSDYNQNTQGIRRRLDQASEAEAQTVMQMLSVHALIITRLPLS